MALDLNFGQMVANMKVNIKKEKSMDLGHIHEMMGQSMLETGIMTKFLFMYILK